MYMFLVSEFTLSFLYPCIEARYAVFDLTRVSVNGTRSDKRRTCVQSIESNLEFYLTPHLWIDHLNWTLTLILLPTYCHNLPASGFQYCMYLHCSVTQFGRQALFSVLAIPSPGKIPLLTVWCPPPSPPPQNGHFFTFSVDSWNR